MDVNTKDLTEALARLQADISIIRRITQANRREPHETAKLSSAWVSLDNTMQDLIKQNSDD